MTSLIHLFAFTISIYGVHSGKEVPVKHGSFVDACIYANSGSSLRVMPTSRDEVVFSMRPGIHEGDSLVYRTDVPFESLKVNDVVLRTGIPGAVDVVHRLHERLPDGSFITLGDANVGQVDPTPLTRDRFVGLVICLFRN